MHGPVGVRCRDCLLPQGKGPGATLDAAKVKQAAGAAIGLTVAWVIIITLVTLYTGIVSIGSVREIGEVDPRLLRLLLSGSVWTPNLLLCGLGGGTVGWVIWRICQRTWNADSVRLAITVGVAIPLAVTLLVGLVLFMATQSLYFATGMFMLRALVAVALSTLMAWLLVTNPT